MDRPILVFGSTGLLGVHLVRTLAKRGRFPVALVHNRRSQLPDGVPVYKTPIAEPDAVRKTMHRYHPAIVINCAAYTDVDGCEDDPARAARVNTGGAENIARGAEEVHARMVQISTDYVFDGHAGPYDETAHPHPINVYGKTKHNAETAVSHAARDPLIIRAASFIGRGPDGHPGFIERMIATLRDGKQVRVAIDQVANITDVPALAEGIAIALEKDATGMVHFGSRELISRYDLALLTADVFSLDKSLVEPVMYDDLKRPARRPLNGGLIVRKAEDILGFSFPAPKQALENLRQTLADG
jgi:dTDP-4-dehydrorhamnose reductase